MTAKQLPAVRKFNPGLFQTDDEVIAQFAVRKVEFKILLEIVKENICSSTCQHVLIVAPRGRGKTMLLARLAAECRADSSFSGRVIPVRLMEENYEISTLADFWLEALIHLAHELAEIHPDTSLELKASHSDLKSRWQEREIAERARAAFMRSADRLDLHLVLMIENLQALVDNVDEIFGWGLRHALQTESRLTLVASATSRFRALDDMEHAFFEFFRPMHLEPLDTKSCHKLWQALGGGERPESEIEPVRILTGGSPRLIAIIASFASHLSLDYLLEELVALIDEHTEYFRSHLEGMPNVERRVYLALVDLWRPSTTSEIAARASLGIRTVSTMLGRLTNRGAIAFSGTRKKRMYSAVEGLYCIYYKLRRERGSAQIVRDLIRFMRLVFSEREQREILGAANSKSLKNQALLQGLKLAIADEPKLASLLPNGSSAKEGSSSSFDARNEREIFFKRIARSFESREFGQVINLVDQALKKWKPIDNPSDTEHVAQVLVKKAQAHVRLAQFSEARSASLKAIQRYSSNSQPEITELIIIARTVKFVADFLDDNVEMVGESLWDLHSEVNPMPSKSFSLVINEMIEAAYVLMFQNKLELGSRLMDEVVRWLAESGDCTNRPFIALCITMRADAQLQMKLHEDSIKSSERVITQFGEDLRSSTKVAVAHAHRLRALAFSEMGRNAEAIETCDKAVANYGDNVEDLVRSQVIHTLNIKARELEEMGQLEEAIAVSDYVEERYGEDPGAAVQLAVAASLAKKVAVFVRMRRFSDAIANADSIDARYRNELELRAQRPVAFSILEEGVNLSLNYEVDSLEGSVSTALSNKVKAETRSGELESASKTCDDIKRRFERSVDPYVQINVASAIWDLAWALVNFGRAEVALHECKELEVIFDKIKGDHVDQARQLIKWVRIKSYTILDDLSSATLEARSVFTEYDFNDENNIEELLLFTVDAVARGVPEKVFLTAFESDRIRLNQIVPLVVALKQRVGEVVREPFEVIAVAGGIQKIIDVRKAQYIEFEQEMPGATELRAEQVH